MEQLEVTQNKRQNAWQQFQTTKGKTKKVCLLDIFEFLCACTFALIGLFQGTTILASLIYLHTLLVRQHFLLLEWLSKTVFKGDGEAAVKRHKFTSSQRH